MAVGGDRGGGVVCVDFMAINSNGAVTWQATGVVHGGQVVENSTGSRWGLSSCVWG